MPGGADEPLGPDLGLLSPMLDARPTVPSRRRTAGTALRDERGFTLIEMLITMSIFAVALIAVFGALSALTDNATGTEAYSAEVQDAQVGIARITHDLRTAYSIVSAEPNLIEFYQWVNVNGVTQQGDVKYDCSVPQPGTPYDECTRVQAIYPAALPDPTTGAPIVLRLVNGGVDTYCNSDAVFHYVSTASNGSTGSCTEANAVSAAINPVFVEVRVLVPAKGELQGSLTAASFQHTTVLDGGATLRNANLVNQK